MGRKNGCTSKKHGNPGGKSNKYYNNQRARDFSKSRGHEAREVLEFIRQRVRALSWLHKKARKLVANSRLLTTADMATSHLDTNDFCAHVEDLNRRLFQLELQLARAMQESWREDLRLKCLARALELQDRVEYAGDETFRFQLDRTGITISAPSMHMSFLLDEEGLQACADVVAVHERNSRTRKILAKYAGHEEIECRKSS